MSVRYNKKSIDNCLSVCYTGYMNKIARRTNDGLLISSLEIDNEAWYRALLVAFAHDEFPDEKEREYFFKSFNIDENAPWIYKREYITLKELQERYKCQQ